MHSNLRGYVEFAFGFMIPWVPGSMIVAALAQSL